MPEDIRSIQHGTRNVSAMQQTADCKRWRARLNLYKPTSLEIDVTDEEIIDLVKNVTGWTIHFKTSFDPLGHFYSVASNKASVQQIIDIARALLSASQLAVWTHTQRSVLRQCISQAIYEGMPEREKVLHSILAASPAAPAQSGEPVAWRCRHSEGEKWHYGLTPQNWWECQALYAGPQPAQTERALMGEQRGAIRWALDFLKRHQYETGSVFDGYAKAYNALLAAQPASGATHE
ncbi:hypothetical protein FSO04_24360 [Paraburkholderia madseniana]|uniref:Uncharacterized protein n=1 Tax=Paraburkholderia madseniana TaxID=2599607 RepID=A0A6N6WA67_9BURK|nr:hypothetical protein [Paraburkholderia madseniana]KAE8757356.1 hypothetical protein FSO04_24360 [Paraburkholderia madseniana]